MSLVNDLLLKLQSFGTRIEKLMKEGRRHELKEEVENLEYLLSVANVGSTDDPYTSDALQGYMDQIHEMIRLNPNDCVNSDDEECTNDPIPEAAPPMDSLELEVPLLIRAVPEKNGNEVTFCVDPGLDNQNPENLTGQNPTMQFLLFHQWLKYQARLLDTRKERPNDWGHSSAEEPNKTDHRSWDWNKSATASVANLQLFTEEQLAEFSMQVETEDFHHLGTDVNQNNSETTVNLRPVKMTKSPKQPQTSMCDVDKEEATVSNRMKTRSQSTSKPPVKEPFKSPGPRNVVPQDKKGKQDDGTKKRVTINKKSKKSKQVTSDKPARKKRNLITKTRRRRRPKLSEESSEDEDNFEPEEQFIRKSADPKEADSILKGLKEHAQKFSQNDKQPLSSSEKLCFSLKNMGFEANLPTKPKKSTSGATAKPSPANKSDVNDILARTENNSKNDAASEMARGIKRKHLTTNSFKLKAKKRKKGLMTRAQLIVKNAITQRLKNKKQKLKAIPPGIVTNLGLTKIKLECDYIVPKEEPLEDKEEYVIGDSTRDDLFLVNEEDDDRMSIESINIKDEPDDEKDEENNADLNPLQEPNSDIDDDEGCFAPRISVFSC